MNHVSICDSATGTSGCEVWGWGDLTTLPPQRARVRPGVFPIDPPRAGAAERSSSASPQAVEGHELHSAVEHVRRVIAPGSDDRLARAAPECFCSRLQLRRPPDQVG